MTTSNIHQNNQQLHYSLYLEDKFAIKKDFEIDFMILSKCTLQGVSNFQRRLQFQGWEEGNSPGILVNLIITINFSKVT